MSVAQLCPTLCDPMDCSLPGSSVHGIPQARINTGVGCHSLLQGIFLTQGLNPGLLHCRWILYHWCHLGSPIALGRSVLSCSVTLNKQLCVCGPACPQMCSGNPMPQTKVTWYTLCEGTSPCHFHTTAGCDVLCDVDVTLENSEKTGQPHVKWTTFWSKERWAGISSLPPTPSLPF